MTAPRPRSTACDPPGGSSPPWGGPARGLAREWLAPSLDCFLAQPEALQLAGLGARQRIAELDRARVLVRRNRRLDEVLQLAHQRVAGASAVAQHDVGLDDLAALRIGRADHRALGHRSVLQQRLL